MNTVVHKLPNLTDQSATSNQVQVAKEIVEHSKQKRTTCFIQIPQYFLLLAAYILDTRT